MIFENDFYDVIDRRADSRNLDQYLSTVSVMFNHRFDGFHVPDCTVHAVDHSLCIFMVMTVMLIMQLFIMSMLDNSAVTEHMGVCVLRTDVILLFIKTDCGRRSCAVSGWNVSRYA